jgi:hypothetical protein
MAKITKRFTMGWYGGCECEDVQVNEVAKNLFGKIKFTETTSEGVSYNTMKNSSPFSFAKLRCGGFYIVTNETSPVEEFDLPNFYILNTNGQNLSRCCQDEYSISITDLTVLQKETNNIEFDVSLKNVNKWSYAINGNEKKIIETGTTETFTAPVGSHTLVVYALDENDEEVDEESRFFEVKELPTELPDCCSEFQYIHTKSTSEDEHGSEFNKAELQTGKNYGYVELQRAKGPYSSIKPELDVKSMCHNGATSPDPMPPMDIQSVQNFENDGMFDQKEFVFKHGEIAFGRQYQGKIQVTLMNNDCYEGCVCPSESEVNLSRQGEISECNCN